MTEKPKIRFLTVIWGARYAEEFAALSLPSYLSPGNLPAMAEEADLEILIMTTEETEPTFEAQPNFQKLRALCPVRFLHIDDLITTGVYGVTLTLAYARGIRDAGEEQVNTTFVFMNSDFVLADGSLRYLTGLIRDGARCVMAPSLRANSEPVVPVLTERVADGVLAMPPREMVRLAFDHLHPTVVGKTANQELVKCSTHNQVYWQVDEATLLARYYLIFMLAIRPERPIGPVRSYCDYGFVPDMVPSGDITVTGDSDDFFMLELAPTQQEKQFLSMGVASPKEIAASLSKWTTREHRLYAERDTVFHWRDLPANLDGHRAALDRTMRQIASRMSRRPLDDEDHFYWEMGVLSWRLLQMQELGLQEISAVTLPPELFVSERRASSGWLKRPLSSLRRLAERRYRGLLKRMKAAAGDLPRVAPWHHLWLDSRLLREWEKRAAALGPSARILVIHPVDSPVAPAMRQSLGAETIDAAGLLGPDFTLASVGYDRILIHMLRADLRETRTLLDCATEFLAENGEISVFVEHRDADTDPSNFSYEFAGNIECILPGDWMRWQVQARFVGGRAKRYLRAFERRVIARLAPPRPRGIPVFLLAFLAWPVVALCTGINNWHKRNLISDCPNFCSAALFTLAPRAQSAGRAARNVEAA